MQVDYNVLLVLLHVPSTCSQSVTTPYLVSYMLTLVQHIFTVIPFISIHHEIFMRSGYFMHRPSASHESFNALPYQNN